MQLDTMTAETMMPLVGTIFHVNGPGGQSYDFELKDVQKVLDKHVDSRFRRDSFSLYFICAREPYLPQATYSMTHETLGELALFLVPNSRVQGGYRYEAVFT